MAAEDTESTAGDPHKQKLLDSARALEEGKREREPEPDIEVEEERLERDEPEEQEEDEEREEVREPRQERRTNRYAEAQRQYEEERARRMALEAQIAATRQPAAPQRSQEELRTEAQNQYRADLEAVQRARMDLQQVVQANRENFTEDVRQRVMTEDTNLRLYEAEAQRRYMARMDQIERPPPAPPPNPAAQVVVARYQEVVNDPLGFRYADTYYLEQKRKDPNRDNLELLEESLKYGRSKMRGEAFSPATRERSRPTAQQKAKYVGTGGNGAVGGPPDPSVRQTISKDEDRLAQKLYAHIQDPAERRRMFYKNVKMKKRA